MAACRRAPPASRGCADGDGPPLCVVDDFAYRPGASRMRAGDMLCIVSDGVTEAADAAGALYGPERVERTLASARTAREAVDALARDVRRSSPAPCNRTT